MKPHARPKKHATSHNAIGKDFHKRVVHLKLSFGKLANKKGAINKEINLLLGELGDLHKHDPRNKKINSINRQLENLGTQNRKLANDMDGIHEQLAQLRNWKE